MKKTKLLLASLFFILLGIAFSCKVDLEDLQEPTINSDLLNNLRQSFEQNAKTDPFLKTAKIDPAWNNAIVFENSVELPFGENGVVHRPSLTTDNGNTGRERLVLTQKNGKLKTFIIRYMPSKEYKGKIHEINLNNLKANRFSGKVAIQILGSKKIRIYSFANGKSYKQYKGKIVKIGKKGRVAACYEEGFWDCNVKMDERGEQYIDCVHTWVEICDDEDEGDDDEEDPDICEIIPSLCEQDPCLMDPANCSGGGGDDDADNNVVQVEGRLCGNYTFTPTGNGRTAEIHGLGSHAYNYSNQNHVSASWGAMCVTFGSNIQTSNNASIAFNLAWNNTLQLTDVWLAAHPNATSLEFKHMIENLLRTQLGPASGGYSALTIGGCDNITASNAQYCP